MNFLKQYYKLLNESLDSGYRWKGNIETELVEQEDEDEEGQPYMKDVMSPVQIFKFKTDDDVPYIVYLRQNRYDDTAWNFAFGIHTGENYDGSYALDIGITNTGNAFQVFSTVIDILNYVIFRDDDYEIQTLIFTSEGEKRTKLYTRLLEKIENFEVDDIRKDGDETTFVLVRNY